MLRNTSSIPSAFRFPPTKNYLTDHPNTIFSAIAEMAGLCWWRKTPSAIACGDERADVGIRPYGVEFSCVEIGR